MSKFLRRVRPYQRVALMATALALVPVVGVQGQELLYVASQEEVTVAVIDMRTNQLVKTVDLKELGYSETAKAHHTAVEPDGSHWYVSLIAAGKVLKFDRDNQLVDEAAFEPAASQAHSPSAKTQRSSAQP